MSQKRSGESPGFSGGVAGAARPSPPVAAAAGRRSSRRRAAVGARAASAVFVRRFCGHTDPGTARGQTGQDVVVRGARGSLRARRLKFWNGNAPAAATPPARIACSPLGARLPLLRAARVATTKSARKDVVLLLAGSPYLSSAPASSSGVRACPSPSLSARLGRARRRRRSPPGPLGAAPPLGPPRTQLPPLPSLLDAGVVVSPHITARRRGSALRRSKAGGGGGAAGGGRGRRPRTRAAPRRSARQVNALPPPRERALAGRGTTTCPSGRADRLLSRPFGGRSHLAPVGDGQGACGGGQKAAPPDPRRRRRRDGHKCLLLCLAGCRYNQPTATLPASTRSRLPLTTNARAHTHTQLFISLPPSLRTRSTARNESRTPFQPLCEPPAPRPDHPYQSDAIARSRSPGRPD